MNDSDLYSILGVTKEASASQIKNAYRACCLKYHPDKNLHDNAGTSKLQFQNAQESYSILSNLELRQKYDCHGWKGLRSDVDDDGGGGGEHQQSPFTKYNSKDIFDKFFQHEYDNPFQDMGLFDTMDFQCKERKFNDNSNGDTKDTHCRKTVEEKVIVNTVYHDLPCDLEELCLGGDKVIKITRKRYSTKEQRLIDDVKHIVLKIEPGWREGMKIHLHKEGDEEEHSTAAGDLIFTIREIPHEHFHRDGNHKDVDVASNNLYYTAHISLCQALAGCTLRVPTLHGKTLLIPCPEVIHPNYEKRIKREGIPISDQKIRRGDLIIKFNILFPKVLTLESKQQLKSIFSAL